VGSGCPNELAMDLLKTAPAEIIPSHRAGDYLPNFIMEFHDLSQVGCLAVSHLEVVCFFDNSQIFGDNYERLRQIKTKYDPAGRLNKGFFIPPL
jgi:FAD/FMN-containing dehydrogenase